MTVATEGTQTIETAAPTDDNFLTEQPNGVPPEDQQRPEDMLTGDEPDTGEEGTEASAEDDFAADLLKVEPEPSDDDLVDQNQLPVDPKEDQPGEEGVPAPEKKPEEVELPVDEEFDALETDNPQRDNYRKMRERDKRQRQENAQLKAQLEAIQNQQTPQVDDIFMPTTPASETPVYQPKTAAEQQHLDPSQVFTVLAQNMDGELNADANIRREAHQYIADNMTPGDIRDVMIQAQNGAYGEFSETVSELAVNAFPIVQTGYAQRQEQDRVLAEGRSKRDASWLTLFKENPKIQSGDTDEGKAFRNTWSELRAVYPNLDTIPHAPQLVFDHMQMRAKASRVSELETQIAAFSKQIERLTKSNASARSPQGVRGSTPITASGGEESAESEFEKSIASLKE